MSDRLAKIADCLERIASHFERQVAESKKHIEKHEAFDRNRTKLLKLIDADKRFAGLWDRVANCQDLGIDVVNALASRDDPLVLLNEICLKPALARKLSWVDEDGLAVELQAVERRLALSSPVSVKK